MIARRLAAVAVLLSFATSCAIGPNFVRPPVAAPEDYRGQVQPSEATSIADLPWWEVFQDDVLQQLILEALTANHDLKIAVQRVEQARALAGVARSPFYPQLGYEGSGGRQRQPQFQDTPGVDLRLLLRRVFAGLGTRHLGPHPALERSGAGNPVRHRGVPPRRAVVARDGRRAVLPGAARARPGARDRARDHGVLPGDARPLHAALRGRRRQQAAGRARAGRARRDAAQIPDLERRIVFQENAISVLLGRNPGPIARGTPFAERPVPPATPPGLPSALLERRPGHPRGGAQHRERERAGGRRDRELLPADRSHRALRRPEHRTLRHREGELQHLERGRQCGGSALPGLLAAPAIPRAEGGLGGGQGDATSRP